MPVVQQLQIVPHSKSQLHFEVSGLIRSDFPVLFNRDRRLWQSSNPTELTASIHQWTFFAARTSNLVLEPIFLEVSE